MARVQATTKVLEHLKDATNSLQFAARLISDGRQRDQLNESFLKIREVRDFFYRQETEDRIRDELDQLMLDHPGQSISADDLVAIRGKLKLGTLDRVAEVYNEWKKDRP